MKNFLLFFFFTTSLYANKIYSPKDLVKIDNIYYEKNTKKKANGKEIEYRRSGIPRYILLFKNGLRSGDEIEYSQYGYKITISTFENDKLIFVKNLDELGNILSVSKGKKDIAHMTWYNKGKKRVEIKYHKFDPIETFFYDEKGNPISTKHLDSLKKGKRHKALWKLQKENLTEKLITKDNKKYDINGLLRSETINLKDGKVLNKNYFLNGKIKKEEIIDKKNNTKEIKEYFITGDLYYEKKTKNNKRVYLKTYPYKNAKALIE